MFNTIMEIMKNYYTINTNVDSVSEQSERVIKTAVSSHIFDKCIDCFLKITINNTIPLLLQFKISRYSRKTLLV